MELSGQLHAPAALPPGKEPRYPLDRRPGGPHNRSGRCGEEKNLSLPGIEPGLFSPSLYQLSWPGFVVIKKGEAWNGDLNRIQKSAAVLANGLTAVTTVRIVKTTE
jgi:hypothetical protein